MTPGTNRRRSTKTTKKTSKRTSSEETLLKYQKKRTILVTGYPGSICKNLVRTILENEPKSVIYFLVQEKFIEDAKKFVRGRSRQGYKNVNLLSGDIADMHLGLSAEEVKDLLKNITDIYHLASISYLGVPDELMWQVNVQGTTNLIELAQEARRLNHFNYISTAFVSGDRQGVVTEEELDCGQKFRNLYERTKFEAERKIRDAMGRLPITVFRPSIVVGDSRTGEIGRFDGPYYLGILLASSPLSSMALIGNEDAPLHVIPVDYAVNAILYISRQRQYTGKTFHIVDPNPISVKSAYELVARCIGINKEKLGISSVLPKGVLAGFAKILQTIPGVERLSRTQRQAIDYTNSMTFYNSFNTTEALRTTQLSCPPLQSYADNLVAYVRKHFESKRKKREDEEDPLA